MLSDKNSYNSVSHKSQQLYFSRLYHGNRKLFYVVVSFVFATICCNLLGYEATPFFVWGMYSEKEKDPGFYEVQEVVANESQAIDLTNGYTPSTRFFLNAPLAYYTSIKKNSRTDPTITFLKSKLLHRYEVLQPYEHRLFNDTTRINAFGHWFKRYLEQITKTKIEELKIVNTRVHYEREKIVRDSSYVFEQWD